MKCLCFSFFSSYLNYGNIAWCSTSMAKIEKFTAWKESKYGVFYGPYFPVRIEYGDLLHKYPHSVQIQESVDQKNTPYLDIFYAVIV